MTKQPRPHGKGPNLVDLVIQDHKTRAKLGEKQYGEKLKPFNGRDALQDLYEELMDASLYIKQAMYERESTEGSYKILLYLWIATFGKYESWIANKVPLNAWPKHVVRDYKKLSRLTDKLIKSFEADNGYRLSPRLNRKIAAIERALRI